MNYLAAKKKLSSIHQEQLLKFWEQLSAEEQTHLLEQIETIDLDTLSLQQEALQKKSYKHPHHFSPFRDFSWSGNEKDFQLGKKLIASGKVGTLLIAGGQGTRLGITGPKGTFPISPIKKKSLFQLFAEKTAAASKQAQRPLPIAIMTSLNNHKETVSFFKENNYFGLDLKQINFFYQDSLPLLDKNQNLFLEDKQTIAVGPNGNGYALKYFYESSLWDEWKQAGVEYLNFVLVDNPLADPFDAELSGFHARMQGEVVIKCTEREDENEKVGLLVKENQKVQVIEYTEFPEAEKLAREADGSFRHVCANLSLFSFHMDFIFSMRNTILPFHPALKTAVMLNADEELEKVNIWKFETFIFDLLPLARSVQALLYPREACFAPLKNSQGNDSVETVQRALILQAKNTLERLTGQIAAKYPRELSADYYYPTKELLAHWKNRSIPSSDYLE